MKHPFVSIQVVNFNGLAHLDSCLSALVDQEYPRDRFEIVLVDNASTDGSVGFIEERFPQVRICRYPRNLGFAGGYHASIQASSADFVALLNNDTRVNPEWLGSLVDASERHGAAVVASKIVDWEGQRVDFGGGILTLVGHAWQRHNGKPASTHAREETPLLFGCAGAMLIERGAYEAAGGFDPNYFAYFEDVDLGWRVSLLGYKTIFAPEAVTYHRLHGTAGRYAFSPRLRLYERNALLTIYKCLEDDTLRRVLPVALALTLARGLRSLEIDPRRFDFGASPPADVSAAPQTIATLLALEDFSRSLPRLNEQRRTIQARRRRSDEELFPLFVEPLKIHSLGEEYATLAGELYEEFGLSELVGARDQGTGARNSGPEPKPKSSAPGPPPSRSALRRGSPKFAASARSEANEGGRSLTPDPLVSVVILTALGPAHLGECLPSVAALDFPLDRLEVIVVDNGSQTDPTLEVRKHFPDARVIRLDRNTGFCRGNNVGAHGARGEWLFFLNDDTRLHPECLRETLATARQHGAASVGARILDWTGDRLDFGGAAVSFEGRGYQIDVGSSARDRAEERPILFGCGAALLIDRDLFLELGGFDEAMFAYYEDVALGWRLWLNGHQVWLSPKALVYHKHHGTSGAWSAAPRSRLLERNGLRLIFTLLERRTLERVLPAALLLAAYRALWLSRLEEPADEGLTGLVWALRRFYRRVKHVWAHTRAALAVRGASRTRSVLGNVRHLGARRIMEALWSTATFLVRNTQRDLPRRTGYLMESGLQPPSFDAKPEPLPVEAAAVLVALKEWLGSIPEQRARRRDVQGHRTRSDFEALSPFSSHWTFPNDQRPVYKTLHESIVKELRVDESLAAAEQESGAPTASR
jgi:GT2 family glycosyltransferase